MFPIDDPWLELSLVLQREKLTLRDRRYDGSERSIAGEAPLLMGDVLQFAETLPEWIRMICERLGYEPGPHSTGPMVLPVYCRAGAGLPDRNPTGVAAIVKEWLAKTVQVDWARVHIIPEYGLRGRRRKPAVLPLSFCGVGEIGQAALLSITEATWISGDPKVDGLSTQMVSSEESFPSGTDIVAIDRELLEDAYSSLVSGRPRLTLIALPDDQVHDPYDLDSFTNQIPQLPGAVLCSGRALVQDTLFAQHLLAGIVHDLPLHQAFVSAMRTVTGSSIAGNAFPMLNALRDDLTPPVALADWEWPAMLLANPSSNQSLRLRDTALEMLEEVLDLQVELKFQDTMTSRVADRLGHLNNDLGSVLMSVDSTLSEFGFEDFFALERYDFTEESIGLQPRARADAAMKMLREAMTRTAREIDATLDDTTREAIAESQERRVDVTLLRRDVRQHDSIHVARSTRLGAGRRYRLRVGIGRLSPESLVVGESPDFDSLLPVAPPGQTHKLSIVLDPLDFAGEGRLAKRLELPLLGPSESVNFDIVAPKSLGPARLRILVYLEQTVDFEKPANSQQKNHLLQSLLLTGDIAEFEEADGEDQTLVEVEVSKTLEFTNFVNFDRRALSIAFNDDPSGLVHNLLVKMDNTIERFTLDAPMMQRGLETARKILRNAAFADPDSLQGIRFFSPTRTPEEETAFCDAVRGLATLGTQCYEATILRGDILERARALSTSTGEVIEITPLRRTLYPWQIIYDAPLPAPNAEVCDGFRRIDAVGAAFTPRQCLDNCLKGDRSGAFCVYGFWGARFAIAQNFGQRDQAVSAPVQTKSTVAVCVGLTGGPATQLADDLRTALGKDRVVEIGAGDSFVDVLWQQQRPDLVLLVGHTEIEPAPAGLDPQPRITLPGGGWLHPRDISNKWRLSCRSLAPPAPVIVLAACDSAQADLARWVGFVEPLGRAEAGGVVGLEIPITEGFATDLSRQIAVSMCGAGARQSLVWSVLSMRQRLVAEANPLAFCITNFGDSRF